MQAKRMVGEHPAGRAAERRVPSSGSYWYILPAAERGDAAADPCTGIYVHGAKLQAHLKGTTCTFKVVCVCVFVCMCAAVQKAMSIPWNPLNNNHRRKACKGAHAWQTTITHQLLHFANNRAEPAAIITQASERASVWALYNCRVTGACFCSFCLLLKGCEVLIYL